MLRNLHIIKNDCKFCFQIVVCYNQTKNKKMVQGVLAHEMIHMFDFCRKKLDFKNLDHLACTEIRAANLTHCGFISAIVQGDASPFSIKARHQVFITGCKPIFCVSDNGANTGSFRRVLENMNNFESLTNSFQLDYNFTT